jgi:hypothetical protein
MKAYKTIARLTGVGYLIIFISGFFANFYTLESMVVDDNASETAANILAHFAQFKWGVGAFALMVFTDIVLAVPLYSLLKNVSQGLARTSSLLRLINGGVFAIALFSLFQIIRVGQSTGDSLALQVMPLLDQFNFVWNIGLLFFGVHLIIMGCLLSRSAWFPKTIGWVVQMAGFAYLIDSGAQLWFSQYQSYQSYFEILVIGGGVIGEFSLTLWLLIRGIKVNTKVTVPLANSI